MRLRSVYLAVAIALISSFFAMGDAAAQSGLPDAGISSAPDRAAGLQLAFTRAQHLRRGINTSAWFAQQGHYPAAQTNSFINAQDVALMARMGFDHARLAIDPAPLETGMGPYPGADADFLPRLDRAVDMLLNNGLAVIIDIQPGDDYKQQLRTSDDAVERFTMLWRKLAAHYAGRDADRVFFEILNEPELTDSYRWAGIQQRVAAAIRQAAPRNTIIATGANYSGIPELVTLEPLADGNVIYNFHFYEPHEFTHQGATWGLAWWSYTHSIPYPPQNASMRALLPQVPDAADRYELENYWLDQWNGNRIRMLIDEAAAWGRDKNVPLLCDEFGVYRQYTDPVSRANWIRDVRTSLEADGIGWTMWEYRGGFGVVTKQDGQAAQPDENTLRALGLSGR